VELEKDSLIEKALEFTWHPKPSENTPIVMLSTKQNNLILITKGDHRMFIKPIHVLNIDNITISIKGNNLVIHYVN
jgi:hypothetical protein